MSDMNFLHELALESIEQAGYDPHQSEQSFNVGMIALQDAEATEVVKREAVLSALDAYMESMI